MTYRLHGAPPAFATESANSWLQRLAHRYDLSFPDLLDAVGARWSADVDVSLTREEYGSIARTCGRAVAETNLMYSIFCAGLGAKLARIDSEGRPLYGFCIGCFREDKVPHLRIEWRLKCWTTCPVHQLPLRDQCGVCGAPWTMDLAILRERRSKARSLAHCQKCGGDQRQLPGEKPSATSKYEAALGRAVVSALASGYATVTRGGVRKVVHVGYVLELLQHFGAEELISEPYVNLVIDTTKRVGLEHRLAMQRSGVPMDSPPRTTAIFKRRFLHDANQPSVALPPDLQVPAADRAKGLAANQFPSLSVDPSGR